MNALTRWNPFRELDAIQNRLTALFGAPLLLPSNGRESIRGSEWAPLVDILEDDKEFTIKAELPDVKKEDVKVTVEDGSLHISGERKFQKEEHGRRYHRVERAYGSFERVFVLPESAKTEEVKASFHDGMLEVHLPKTEQERKKSLEIAVS